MRNLRLLLCTALIAACGAREKEPARSLPRAEAAKPAQVAAVSSAPSAPSSSAPPVVEGVRLEAAAPAATPEPPPHVEIKFPIAEQAILVPKALAYKVRLKVEHWPLARSGRGVELALDTNAPRRVESLEGITLGDLLDPGAALKPGDHLLVLSAVHQSGELVRARSEASRAPFAAVHFWVGERGTARGPERPILVQMRPRGTYNGAAAADAMIADFLLLGAELRPGGYNVLVRITSAGAGAPPLALGNELLLERGQPVRISGLPSGDYLVELALRGPGAGETRVARSITVNRDAPVPPMNSPFLCGVLAAWAVAQVGLGAFFVLAFALARREAEYLLFALLCFALAITSAGVSWGYGTDDTHDWLVAAIVSHGGAILSSGVNFHFVLRYSGARIGRPVLGALYTLVLFYEGVNALGYWWKSDRLSEIDSQVLGFTIRHATADPGFLAMSFYVVGASALVAGIVLLAQSRRPGRRESLVAMAGATVLTVAGVNDIFLMTHVLRDTVYLLPHAFLVYAFGMASNLVVRYQATAGALHETESSLAQATEELRHSHAELLQVQSELVSTQQLAAVGELAAAIAHEVRNPLAIIVNAVAGLRRSGLREEDRTMLLGIVDEETARLNRLVTDLLRFARPVNVKRSLVSLPELAHRSESLVKEGHTIEVSVASDPDLQSIEVDPGLLRLVFDNLVENACQAMPGGGTVKIEVDRAFSSAALISIAIKDSGHGMDADVLQRATHPFFTTRPSGTGLGLPIVQRIVEAHGGRLELESQPGVGTCVRLLLPVRSPEIAEIPYEPAIRSAQKSA